MKYQEITPRTKEQAEAALVRDQPEELVTTVLSVGLHSDDLVWSQDFCCRLFNHSNEFVRGNAILAIGHIARRFGVLDEILLPPLIEEASADPSPFVQGQLESCKEDLQLFVGWKWSSPHMGIEEE
ncbi:MAG: hypothetical protein KJ069_17555 [Anaerolineae bacterium]|nr:hypothetical protein [Anaerolineae bacterium]